MNLIDIKGLGEKRLDILKNVGIYDLKDLCAFFPKQYYNAVISSIDNLIDGDFALIKAIFTQKPVTKFARKGFNFSRLAAKCLISGKPFYIIYYNRPYISSQIKIDEEYLVFGRISLGKTITILNPIIEALAAQKQLKGIITVYNIIKGISQNQLRSYIEQTLPHLNIASIIPQEDSRNLGLIDLKTAYYTLHFPRDISHTDLAAKTVAIEELTQLMVVYSVLKNFGKKQRIGKYRDVSKEIFEIIETLPYTLTQDQQITLKDIFNDFQKKDVMSRLIQGDVGSGKSIIAFLSLYYAVLNNYQGIIMAPTEILARQHYQNLLKLFPELKITYLSSGLNANMRAIALEEISSTAQIIVGTHSLFQENIKFNNPALAVIDEQQRFGVAQRKALEDKGINIDILLLSATPIPRTLSLVLYGDLDISIIKSVPSSKAGSVTRFVPSEKIDEMYEYIKNQAKKGVQAFIVAPKIEDDAIIGGASVISVFNLLKKKLGENIKTELLHGKMKDYQKDKIMQDYAEGKIDVLISTTVIEVGIDVPNASIMVILNAEKFGLSQLHQLRGRIGRGTKKGYCFLVSESNNQDSKERLKIFQQNEDGFFLAEYDMQMRGSGDFLGTRQHGLAGIFNNIRLNSDWINISRDISTKILNYYQNENKKTELKDFLSKINPKYFELIKNVTLN